MRTFLTSFVALLLLAAAGMVLFFGEADEPEGVAVEEAAERSAREPPPQRPALPLRPRAESPPEPAAAGPGEWEPDEPAPPGTLENEMLIRFASEKERRAFLEAMAELNAELLGEIAGLNAVRIRYGDASVRDRLRRLLSENAEAGHNFLVLSPTLPPPVPGEGGHYVAFGDHALRWMGVPGENSEWGRGVTLAVLDTGISPHRDFGGRVFQEFDLLGDFEEAAGYQGHGTAVASLAAGDRGVAPGADVLSFKVLDGDGAGNSFTLAQGIVEAVDRGARVLNLSLGTFGESAILEEAVNYALEHDALIVAAAGNEGAEGVPYPARYDGVLTVAAVDAQGRRAPFSNVSAEVDLAAPGVGVHAAWGEDEFIEFSGTSGSTGFVSGAAAAILSEDPSLSSAQVADILTGNANDVGAPGWNPATGGGVIDMDRIMRRNEPGIYDLAVSDFYLPAREDGAAAPLQVTVQNRGTEAVNDVELNVLVDGEPKTFSLGAFDRGEVKAAEIPLDWDRLTSEQGVEILSQVAAPGIEDGRPANDGKGARLRLLPEEEHQD